MINKGKLVYPPDDLVQMSVRLGVDMTPNNDLDKRLDVFVELSKMCQDELVVLATKVAHYAASIKGLDEDELKRLVCELSNQTDANAVL